ncbi:MAG: hypothetical protein WC519_00750 [Parcubacteria group bacterium]
MSRKWILPSLGVVITISAAIIGFSFIPKEKFIVPESFAEARINGALIADFLNEFSDQSINTIGEIEEKDKATKYDEALNLTIQELQRVDEARAKTIELLGELEKMASSLPSVPDDEAQALGMQAITTEISLVDKLLNYNEKTRNLLDVLRKKFTSYTPENFNTEMTEITEAMNEDAVAINELNRKYQTLMEEFDGKIK